MALWISSGLDTFRSVAPNWSPLRRAFALKRNEGKEDEKDKERGRRGEIKGRMSWEDIGPPDAM